MILWGGVRIRRHPSPKRSPAGEPVVNSTGLAADSARSHPRRGVRQRPSSPTLRCADSPAIPRHRTARNRHIVARATTASSRNRAVGE